MIPKGLQFVAWAAFFFSIMTLMAKVAGNRLPAVELVLARSLVGVAMGYWMLRAAKINPWGKNKKLLIFRGLTGSIALLCFFWSLVRLPLAEATVLFYMSPVFAAVLAAIFLREPLRLLESLGLGLNILGVVLVAQPEFLFGDASQGHDLVAIAVGLLGAMMAGSAYAAVRELRKSDHHLVVVFYFPLISVLICTPLIVTEYVPPTLTEWLLLLGIGVFTQIAQIYLTKGLNLEKASRAMSVSYLQILLAVAWGFLFLNEIPNDLTLFGALMIIGGTLIVTHNPQVHVKLRHPGRKLQQHSP